MPWGVYWGLTTHHPRSTRRARVCLQGPADRHRVARRVLDAGPNPEDAGPTARRLGAAEAAVVERHASAFRHVASCFVMWDCPKNCKQSVVGHPVSHKL